MSYALELAENDPNAMADETANEIIVLNNPFIIHFLSLIVF